MSLCLVSSLLRELAECAVVTGDAQFLAYVKIGISPDWAFKQSSVNGRLR